LIRHPELKMAISNLDACWQGTADDETSQDISGGNDPSDEPILLKATAVITGNPTAKQDGRVADMLLLFLAAGGTTLGTLLGAACFLYFTKPQTPTLGWMTGLLAITALGGLCGCAVVMVLLHAPK
jgi:hypothetical protein